MNVCMYVCMNVCMYVCMNVCMYVNTYIIYTYIHTYIYIDILIERMADVMEIRSGFCQLSECQTGFTSEIQSPADGGIYHIKLYYIKLYNTIQYNIILYYIILYKPSRVVDYLVPSKNSVSISTWWLSQMTVIDSFSFVHEPTKILVIPSVSSAANNK